MESAIGTSAVEVELDTGTSALEGPAVLDSISRRVEEGWVMEKKGTEEEEVAEGKWASSLGTSPG